jgi:CheY-like chemotaxis protein
MTHIELRPILLVEDSPSDAFAIRTLLEGYSKQYPITHVERLSEALTRLTQEEFAVVLLDLSLPDSTGLDTIRAIQTQLLQVPIIVLTGLDNEEIGIKAVQEGAQDYLIKGQFVAGAFIRSINYAIERHPYDKTCRRVRGAVVICSRTRVMPSFRLPRRVSSQR